MVSAQDAVKTDPKHYTVVSENDQVRILKVHYGPHEKSIMHSPPRYGCGVPHRCQGAVQFPDGEKTPFAVKAGDAPYDAPLFTCRTTPAMSGWM
jgi:hypothetical protein